MLERLSDFLRELPKAKPSGDQRQVYCLCPKCDYEGTSRPHLSILVDPEPGEAIMFNCFRASCGWKGALTTELLRTTFECTDENVLSEVAEHNLTVNPALEKKFEVRESRDIVLANLPTGNNEEKRQYICNRLGWNIPYDKLRELKIQLSLFDMLRINDIRRLAVGENRARLLDVYCIGFVSIFNDYLIARDITPDKKTGDRYYNYRIAGKASKGDVKIYSIPRELDLLDPRSAVINVAEGPFSILGAYLNTDLGAERKNNLWLANCGAQYETTIMRVCKQYGLVKARINIWSDSEIKLGFYRKLYNSIKDRLDIRKFSVLYNVKAEDFGHRKQDIKINAVTVKGD